MMLLETRDQPLASRSRFFGRLAASLLGAATMIAASVGLGMLGYRFIEGMAWTDAFLHAAMMLSGMGSLSELATAGGKIFAGSYALYSGFIVVVATGFVLAPVVHRFLHWFHLDEDSDSR